MTEQLNAVNYLRLPFLLRSGFGGLVRNNCTVSTYPGGSGIGGEAFASSWVQFIDLRDTDTLLRAFPLDMHYVLRTLG